MNSQRALLHTNIPLFKALTPAVAVLTGDVVAENSLLTLVQGLPQFHVQTAAQLVTVNFHRRYCTYHLLPDGIVLVVILHQVAVEICNVLFHSLINSVCVLQQVMAVHWIAFVLVVRFVLPVRFIWEKFRSQRRIKLHFQFTSPRFLPYKSWLICAA